MKIIKIRDKAAERVVTQLERRGRVNIEAVEDKVKEIVKTVKRTGDKALIKYTKFFDKADFAKIGFKVSKSEFKDAYKKLSKEQIDAIRDASRNIKLFHSRQFQELDFEETVRGVEIATILRPIRRVGVYIPGGKAVYPSSVLMTVIPARVAGVKEIFMCSPPDSEGKVDPAVLVAAEESSATAVFKVGGAQAIAAMAYGTETVPKVDKVVGPGNIYVTAAKILVSRDVDIDNPAGPSEIMILADDYANPEFIAADLIAQCEHGQDSLALVTTTSDSLATRIVQNLKLIKEKAGRKREIDKALKNNCWIFLTENLNEAVELVNRIAPEHLEIMVKHPVNVLKKTENAGAIFLGEYSPVAAGDYAAGLNHVLPVGGYAKTLSGLSIRDFTKTIAVVSCSIEGLANLEKTVNVLASIEGFEEHAKSISVRLKR